jgi:hypothetical protein
VTSQKLDRRPSPRPAPTRTAPSVSRSPNTTAEGPPLLWDFLKHCSRAIAPDGTVTRYYSPSAVNRRGDRRRI